MITYLGDDAETNTTYQNGLALALQDASSSTKTWSNYTSATCLTNQYTAWYNSATTDMAGIANTDALVSHTNHTHLAARIATDYEKLVVKHPTGTSAWFLPSAGQWYKMTNAAGSYDKLVANTGMVTKDYWSSTEADKNYAWRSYYNGTTSVSRPAKGHDMKVRACLAF